MPHRTVGCGTSTPGIGRPTHTPSPPVAASISSSEMSATGRHSVMPYGVHAVAFGKRSRAARSSAGRTGAPADSSIRTLSNAARCSGLRSATVRTTLASAAGDANTSVARTRSTASPRAVAVSVPGAPTSMSGTTEGIPSIGPYRANGANAATSRSSAVMSYSDAIASRCAASRGMAVEHTLRGPGRAGRERDRGDVVGFRRLREPPG